MGGGYSPAVLFIGVKFMNTEKCRLCVDFSNRDDLIKFVQALRDVGSQADFGKDYSSLGVYEMIEDDMRKETGVTPKNSFWLTERDNELCADRATLKRTIPQKEVEV